VYNVAFRTILQGSGKEGVITWTAFESKEAFDAFYDEKMRSWYQVVGEGVSEERCIELVDTTPIPCYIRAAVHDARDPKTGVLNLDILDMELDTALAALNLRDERRALKHDLPPPTHLPSK